MKTHLVDVHSKVRIDGPSRGAAQHVEERKGFRIVLRGEVGRMVDHDFECPTHGRFPLSVPSSSVPDVVACNQLEVWTEDGMERSCRCGDDAPWRAPRVNQGFAAGEVTC